MPRLCAVNSKCLRIAAEAAIYPLLAVLMAFFLSTGVQGQGPALTTINEVSYRGQNHAAARVTNLASIVAHQRGSDDGVRGAVREIGLPLTRTSADCETGALALLDDAGPGWAGE
jgi:hypothetical protein